MGLLVSRVLKNDVPEVERLVSQLLSSFSSSAAMRQLLFYSPSFWSLAADIRRSDAAKSDLRLWINGLINEDARVTEFLMDIIAPTLSDEQRKLLLQLLQLNIVSRILRSTVFWELVLDRQFMVEAYSMFFDPPEDDATQSSMRKDAQRASDQKPDRASVDSSFDSASCAISSASALVNFLVFSSSSVSSFLSSIVSIFSRPTSRSLFQSIAIEAQEFVEVLLNDVERIYQLMQWKKGFLTVEQLHDRDRANRAAKKANENLGSKKTVQSSLPPTAIAADQTAEAQQSSPLLDWPVLHFFVHLLRHEAVRSLLHDHSFLANFCSLDSLQRLAAVTKRFSVDFKGVVSRYQMSEVLQRGLPLTSAHIHFLLEASSCLAQLHTDLSPILLLLTQHLDAAVALIDGLYNDLMMPILTGVAPYFYAHIPPPTPAPVSPQHSRQVTSQSGSWFGTLTSIFSFPSLMSSAQSLPPSSPVLNQEIVLPRSSICYLSLPSSDFTDSLRSFFISSPFIVFFISFVYHWTNFHQHFATEDEMSAEDRGRIESLGSHLFDPALLRDMLAVLQAERQQIAGTAASSVSTLSVLLERILHVPRVVSVLHSLSASVFPMSRCILLSLDEIYFAWQTQEVEEIDANNDRRKTRNIEDTDEKWREKRFQKRVELLLDKHVLHKMIWKPRRIVIDPRTLQHSQPFGENGKPHSFSPNAVQNGTKAQTHRVAETISMKFRLVDDRTPPADEGKPVFAFSFISPHTFSVSAALVFLTHLRVFASFVADGSFPIHQAIFAPWTAKDQHKVQFTASPIGSTLYLLLIDILFSSMDTKRATFRSALATTAASQRGASTHASIAAHNVALLDYLNGLQRGMSPSLTSLLTFREDELFALFSLESLSFLQSAEVASFLSQRDAFWSAASHAGWLPLIAYIHVIHTRRVVESANSGLGRRGKKEQIDGMAALVTQNELTDAAAIQLASKLMNDSDHGLVSFFKTIAGSFDGILSKGNVDLIIRFVLHCVAHDIYTSIPQPLLASVSALKNSVNGQDLAEQQLSSILLQRRAPLRAWGIFEAISMHAALKQEYVDLCRELCHTQHLSAIGNVVDAAADLISQNFPGQGETGHTVNEELLQTDHFMWSQSASKLAQTPQATSRSQSAMQRVFSDLRVLLPLALNHSYAAAHVAAVAVSRIIFPPRSMPIAQTANEKLNKVNSALSVNTLQQKPPPQPADSKSALPYQFESTLQNWKSVSSSSSSSSLLPFQNSMYKDALIHCVLSWWRVLLVIGAFDAKHTHIRASMLDLLHAYLYWLAAPHATPPPPHYSKTNQRHDNTTASNFPSVGNLSAWPTDSSSKSANLPLASWFPKETIQRRIAAHLSLIRSDHFPAVQTPHAHANLSVQRREAAPSAAFRPFSSKFLSAPFDNHPHGLLIDLFHLIISRPLLRHLATLQSFWRMCTDQQLYNLINEETDSHHTNNANNTIRQEQTVHAAGTRNTFAQRIRRSVLDQHQKISAQLQRIRRMRRMLGLPSVRNFLDDLHQNDFAQHVAEFYSVFVGYVDSAECDALVTAVLREAQITASSAGNTTDLDPSLPWMQAALSDWLKVSWDKFTRRLRSPVAALLVNEEAWRVFLNPVLLDDFVQRRYIRLAIKLTAVTRQTHSKTASLSVSVAPQSKQARVAVASTDKAKAASVPMRAASQLFAYIESVVEDFFGQRKATSNTSYATASRSTL